MNTNESSTESKGKQVGKQLAYPHTELDPDGRVYGEHAGMTKREVIATAALEGLVNRSSPPTDDFSRGQYLKHLPKLAVELADALLEALSE